MLDTYFKNILKVLAIGAGFASIPLFASLASLQPPWPPAIGSVSAAMVMLGALAVWEWTRKTKIRNRRIAILSAIAVTGLGLAAYLTLYSMFVENVSGAPHRITRGYECTADAALVYKAACPDLPTSALEQAEWDELVLWTRTSVTNVRLALVAAWIAFTIGLVMAVGAVIAGRKM